eukprot:6187084-Pleurochrysis_carterae.AAC.1
MCSSQERAGARSSDQDILYSTRKDKGEYPITTIVPGRLFWPNSLSGVVGISGSATVGCARSRRRHPAHTHLRTQAEALARARARERGTTPLWAANAVAATKFVAASKIFARALPQLQEQVLSSAPRLRCGRSIRWALGTLYARIGNSSCIHGTMLSIRMRNAVGWSQGPMLLLLLLQLAPPAASESAQCLPPPPTGPACEDCTLEQGTWRLSAKTNVTYSCLRSNDDETPCMGGSDVGNDGDGYCVSGFRGPLCEVTDRKM